MVASLLSDTGVELHQPPPQKKLFPRGVPQFPHCQRVEKQEVAMGRARWWLLHCLILGLSCVTSPKESYPTGVPQFPHCQRVGG